MNADEFATAVAESLTRRQRSSLSAAEVVGEFPATELLMKSKRFGWRFALFTDDGGKPMGSWEDIQARLLLYRSASRFATEMWCEFEERENSAEAREAASEPDADGIRWFQH